ncbi:hypothetical protein ACIRQH_19935 [Streptomyces sp. NPDC102279]|uniref:hypothetical protein n=1 Tax=Streptomyces sp. NPDC102279 TaxID=3366153 RepID=UPI0038111580
MSTTANRPHRNQEPEPVRPWFARLFRRPSPETREAMVRGLAAEPAAPLAAAARMGEALRIAKDKAERCQANADSFARELRETVDTLADRTRERDGAYEERAQLLAWLAALHPSTAVIAPSPDVDEDGWQLLYLVAGGWQMSWHIHPRDAHLFRHVTKVDVTDVRAQWDGHGTVQKYERMHNHVRLLALTAIGDGASTAGTTVSEVRSA